MKILVSALSRNLGPTGVCRFAANLCLSIQSFGDPVLVIGKWQQEYFAECFDLAARNIKLVVVEIDNRVISRNLWYRYGLDRLAEDLSPEIVHASFPIPLRRSNASTKWVGTVHDLYPFDSPQNFGFPNYLFNQAAFRSFIGAVQAATCVSETTRARLVNRFPREAERIRPRVIPNRAKSAATPMQPSWLATGQRFFLTVAQHRGNKNLDRVLRAFASARPALQSNTALLIVGEDGPETPALRGLVGTLGISDSVEFQSRLSEGELIYLYQNALALLSPSVDEGFGLPPVEAFHLGCSILVSDIPIFRETVPAADHFVDPYNTAEISNAIKTLDKNPRRRVVHEQSYQNDFTVEQYQEFYDEQLTAGCR